MDSVHAHKGPWLQALTPGESFMGFYTVRYLQLEPFRDASRGVFLTLILSDRSGQLLARVWEGGEELAHKLESGQAVKVQGEVETYLERVQVRILRIRPATAEEYDHRDMLPSSRRGPQEMLAELTKFLDSLQNSRLRALVMTFYGDPQFIETLSQAPAAKRIHHAYLGGLLEHLLELLALSETVCELYPQLDTDLLLTGILLHDIGKVRSFAWENDIDYTTEGRLLGHVTLTDEMVCGAIETIPGFPPELALQVRHMLLAHHGRYEWGAPRRPKTLEAIALHHLDNLVAQLNRFQSILEGRMAGEAWSDYDRLLGRYLYGGEDDLSVEERGWEE